MARGLQPSDFAAGDSDKPTHPDGPDHIYAPIYRVSGQCQVQVTIGTSNVFQLATISSGLAGHPVIRSPSPFRDGGPATCQCRWGLSEALLCPVKPGNAGANCH